MRVLAAFCAILAVGCVETRSQDLACGPGDTCGVGRVCVEGYCVLDTGGDGDIDAASIDGPSADADTSVCTTNNGSVCTIECGGGLACADLVVCPPGLQCIVNCTGTGSCAAGVDCAAAEGGCVINCSGNGSCDGPIGCGPGSCNVTCAGDPSCTGGLDCSSSCACDTSCTGAGSCSPAPMCLPGNPCTDMSGDCSSGAGSCDDC